MRILYGVVGEGMGHATRSQVIISKLLAQGHELSVVVSGRAHAFLKQGFADHPAIQVEEIEGLTLAYQNNQLEVGQSVLQALEHAPESLLANFQVYAKFEALKFQPAVVISDYESWAFFYGLTHKLPVISIDNMQVINRCAHDDFVTDERSASFRLAKAAVKIKLPGAYHYLVSSFFFPPVRKPRTTLVPPILRPQILAARRSQGEHVLVYQTSAAHEELLPWLQQLPHVFRVYGMGGEGQQGNCWMRPFSQDGFVDDLQSARAVIAGGGFSLMSECVHLGVPLLSVPIKGQYEQELNARYLEKLGYGRWAPRLDKDLLADFLAHLEQHGRALANYPRHDNQMLFRCLDELLERVQKQLPPLDRLESAAMGTFEGGVAGDSTSSKRSPLGARLARRSRGARMPKRTPFWLKSFSKQARASIVPLLESGNRDRLACFDADKTLWDEDIGEAFLRYLLAGPLAHLGPGAYADYEERCREDPTAGYGHAVQMMAGLQETDVAQWARQLVAAWPTWRMEMVNLLLGLQGEGVEVFIVSASNGWLIEEAAAKIGLPRDRALGIRVEVENGLLSDRLVQPVTSQQGKVAAIEARTGRLPDLAAGDSLGDLAMLEAATHRLVVGSRRYPKTRMLALAKERGWPVQLF